MHAVSQLTVSEGTRRYRNTLSESD